MIPRALRATCLLLAGTATQGEPVGRGEAVHVVLERGPRGFQVQLRGNTPGPRLTLRGIELSTLGHDGRPYLRLLGLASVRRRGAAWILEATDDAHHCRLTLTPHDDGSLRVRLDDDVGFRSRVLHIALSYRWSGAGPVTWLHQPHVAPEPLDVAPDSCWATPLLVAGSAGGAAALLPDMKQLAGNRRLPWFLAFRTSGPQEVELLHGMGHSRLRAGRLFTLRGAPAAAVASERLSLAHEIRFSPPEGPVEVVAELCRYVWRRCARLDPPPPLESTLRAWIERESRQIATALRPVPRRPGLTWLPDIGATRTGLVAQDTAHRPLAAALAAFEWARQRGLDAQMERARGVPRAFLAAKDIGGLFETRAQVDAEGLHFESEPKNTLSTQDASLTGLWLLRWAAADRSLTEACLDRARRLADFLVRNQWRDGSFAARFDRRNLEPLRALYSGSAETLTCGRLLAAVWRRTREPRFLAAAQRALGAVEPERSVLVDRRTEPDRTGGALRVRPLSARVPLDGALLAFELFEGTGQDRFLHTALTWTHRLLPFQQCWSASPFSPCLLGGIRRGNDVSLWSDVSMTEAAFVLMRAFGATKEAQYLERAAACLQAPFRITGSAHGVRGEDRAENPSSLQSGRASALWWVARFLDLYGDVVVDAQEPRAVAFESLTVTDFAHAPGTVRLRLQASPAAARRRFRTRVIPPPPAPTRVLCNGADQGVHPPARFAHGIHLPAERRLAVSFHPPRLHDRTRSLRLLARVTGIGADQEIRGSALVRDDRGRRFTIALEPTRRRGEGCVLEAELKSTRLPGAERVFVRVEVTDGQRTWVAPPGGPAPITLGRASIVDCGDDDERFLVAAGGARVATFPDGRGHGRFLTVGGSMTYVLPIPPRALRVGLRLRFTGAIELRIGGRERRTLAPRPRAPFRDAALTLHDRSLWSSKGLELELVAATPGAGVAWIEFTTEGNGSHAAEIGRRIAPPVRNRECRLLVLPVLTAKAASFDREALRLAFFGGPEYRTTAPPRSQPTLGSLAAWIRELSRGKLQLSGRVEPFRPGFRRDADAGLRDLVREALALHAAALAERPAADIVVVVHTGVSGPPGRIVTLPDRPQPSLVVSLTDARGALAPLGELARLLLTALTELPPAHSAAGGWIGRHVLTGQVPGSHTPSLPLGLRMHELGWLPILEAAPEGHAGVVLPRIDDGGFVLALPHPGLPGRGRLLLEQRPRAAAGVDPVRDPAASGTRMRGLLPYWDLAARSVHLGVPGTPMTRPRIARVRPDGSIHSTLPRDALWPGSGGLAVHTAHGERTWRLRNLVERERGAGFDIDCGFRDLLAPASNVRIGSRLPGHDGPVPLAIGPEATAAGGARRRAGALVVRLPAGRGSRIRLTWDGALGPPGARLIGTVRGRAVRLRTGVSSGGGEETRMRLTLEDGAGQPEHFLVTVPPERTASSLFVDLENLTATARPTLTLERLQLVDLTRPVIDLTDLVPAGWLQTDAQRMSDGNHYGPVLVLGRGARAVLDVPIKVPHGGAVLRLQAGLHATAAPGSRRVFTAEFRQSRSSEGQLLIDGACVEARAAPLPLWLVDLQMLENRTGFLILRASEGGPPLHFTISSLRER